jgi:SIR2-like domain
LKSGTIVPVVGAGVSMSTCKTPGWKTLLVNGRTHLLDRGLLSKDDDHALQTALDGNALTRAASLLQNAMGAPGGEYPAWLNREFNDKDWPIISYDLIIEVLDLPCPLIATTNYDQLLERFDTNFRRETIPTRASDLVSALRDKGVLHLHGVYTDPSSVILSDSDYKAAITNKAYRSIIQTIWITRSMLFIGCSFDGITDPDFSHLFDWAYATFGPTQHRHYAVVPNALATIENNQRFLLGRHRLQLIPYGCDRSDLPGFVAELNPARAEARLRRARRASEILGEPASGDFSDYINAVGPFISPLRIAQFELRAKAAFDLRRQRLELDRAHLMQVISIFENIPERKEIIRLYNRWGRGLKYTASMHRVCMAALTAMGFCSRDLLRKLHLRDILIPETVRNGWSQQQVQLLDQIAPAKRQSELAEDDYGHELVGRLLRSFAIIVSLDPMKVFPPPSGSGMRVDARGTFVAIGASKGVDVLDINKQSVIASLKTDGPVRDLLELDYEGSRALLVLLTDSAFIWDPRRASLPLVEIEFKTARGAHDAIALPNSRSAFYIWSNDGHLSLFENFRQRRKWDLKHPMMSFCYVGNQLFACRYDWAQILTISEEGSIITLIDRDVLIEYIFSLRDRISDISSLGKDDDEIKHIIYLRLAHIFIRRARFNDDELLAICFRYSAGNSAALLWKPDIGWRGHWFFQGRAAEIASFHDNTGPGMVATLLTHYNKDERLMLWARCTNDSNLRQFKTVNDGLSVSEDIFCLSRINSGEWLAADNSGSLFVVDDNGRYTKLSASVGSNPRKSIVLRW